MTTITTRAGKGSPLTHAELDANFTNLNANKLEESGGQLQIAGKFVPTANGTQDHGTSLLRWGTSWMQALDVAGAATIGGNLGVGTAPSFRLHVIAASANAATTVGNFVHANAGASANSILAVASDTAALQIGANSSSFSTSTTYGALNEAFIRSSAAAAGLLITTSNGPIRFGTASAERVQLTAAGAIIMGGSATRAIEIAGAGSAGTTNALHIESGSPYQGITLVRNDNATASLGPDITFARTRGTVFGDVVSVASGDSLGGIAWAGADGTDIRTKAAEIYVVVDGTPGSNDMPGRIVLATTPDNAAVPSPALNIYNDGSVLSVRGLIGYGTGAGGTVTQATSKATGVTLNKGSGQITTAADALAAGATATFTFTNSLIAAADQVLVQRQSGGTAGAYNVWCDSSAAGSCTICIRNISAGSLSEAVVLNFKVIKGATA